MSKAEPRHFIPKDREAGAPEWREGTAKEAEQYEVHKELYRQAVEIEANDPLTVALLFRELRAVANADVTNPRVTLTVTFDSIEQHNIQALREFADLTWQPISFGRPELEVVYYRAPWRERA